MEPRRVEDHHAVGCRRHQPRQTKLPQDAGHDLPNGSHRVGKLLLRHSCHQPALRTLLRGRQIQQVCGHPLPHRTKGVDRGLLQGVIQAPVQLLGHRPRHPGILPCRLQEGTGVDPEQTARRQRLNGHVDRATNQDRDPSTSASRA